MFIFKIGKVVVAGAFMTGKGSTSFRCVNEIGFAAVGNPVFYKEFSQITVVGSVHEFAFDCPLIKALEESHIPSIVARMGGSTFYIDSTVKDTFFHTVEAAGFPPAHICEVPFMLTDGRMGVSFMVDCADADNLDHLDFFIGEVADDETRDKLRQFFNDAREMPESAAVGDGSVEDNYTILQLAKAVAEIVRKDGDVADLEVRSASFSFKNEPELTGFFPADN